LISLPFFSNKNRYEVGAFCYEFGLKATLNKFPDVSERTAFRLQREFFESTDAAKEKKELIIKKKGRPLLLGSFDQQVQNIINQMRTHGAVINTRVGFSFFSSLIITLLIFFW